MLPPPRRIIYLRPEESTKDKITSKKIVIEELAESHPEIKKSFNLKKIRYETAEQVEASLLFPWLNRDSPSFSFIYDKLYIKPILKYQNMGETMTLDAFMTIYKSNCLKKLWILGDAGIGKSSLLKYLFLEMLDQNKNVLYLQAIELFLEKESVKVKYIKLLLDGKRKCPPKLLLLIDGIDEAFASNIKEFKKFLNQVERMGCEIWLSCRSQYFEQYVERTYFHRIEIQKWKPEQAEGYVIKYFKENGKINFIKTYLDMYNNQEKIHGFAENPFQLSMLLYVIENSVKMSIKIENLYSLYSEFFRQWMKKESHRHTGVNDDTEKVFEQLYTIARQLYDNKRAVVTTCDTAILGLLITESGTDNNKYVWSFHHRSLMEFILARSIVENMKKGPKMIITKLKNNNRSDVDAFVKAGFQVTPYKQKNHMVRNMISAYKSSKDSHLELTEDERFYIENQIIYYMTRMKGMDSAPIIEFIKSIYNHENMAIMRQGIAYGAANIGVFDIALEFAKCMNPGSIEDITNRSWTLVFYGDMPEEDPLHYTDDNIASWQRSREARLRRLQKKEEKDRAFRMFDLRIMYGFFESRGWKELSTTELEIIKACEIDIPGYPHDVIEFLRWAKQVLIEEYEKHLFNSGS